MPIVSGGGGGGTTFNGGTITNPLILDMRSQPDSVQALRVRYPSTLDFSTKPFIFEVDGQFSLFEFTTNGALSSAGNKLRSTGGAIETTGGVLRVNAAGGATVHTLDPTNGIGFYGTDPVSKPTVAGAKLPADVVMASLLTALAALGLVIDTTT